MTDQTLVYKVFVDTEGVPAAAATATQAIQKVGTAAAAGQKGFAEMAKSTQFTRQQMLALNYTLSDVAASLASGASPFTILLQQGGQLKDSFGGIGPLFSKLASAVTVARVAIGGAATIVGALGFAFVKGMQESIDFEKSLQRTGNAAGLTAGQFNAMAKTVAQSSGVTIGASREILQGLVATGQFGAHALQAVHGAATAMAKAMGQTSEEVVKDFAGMSGGVARWAIEHNRSMNYINADQVRYIRNLEAQGKVAEAQVYAAELVRKAAERVNANLGTLETTWNKLKETASSAWNAMLGVGRAESTVDKLANLREQLASEQERLDFARTRGTANEVAGRQRIVAGLKAQLDALREKDQLERRSAGAQAAQAAKNAKEIEEGSKASVDARFGYKRSEFAREQAIEEYARSEERIRLKRQYDFEGLLRSTYVDKVIELDRQALEAKRDAVDAEIDIEKRRVKETPQDRVASSARVLDLETKRLALLSEQARYEDKVRRGEAVEAPVRSDLQTPNQLFRQFEFAQLAATEGRRRSEAADDAVQQLVRGNREASIALIADARQRGMALIALDEQTLRERIDLESLSAGARQRVEEDLATWRVRREREITTELKPEWQRQLELFRDTTRYMRQAADQFHLGFIDSGREAFTSWVTTGKLSAQSLVNFIQTSFARMAYDTFLPGKASDRILSRAGCKISVHGL